MQRLISAGLNVPKVVAAGRYTILMEKINGKLMKDTNYNRRVLDAVGKMLGKMHDSGVVHGDFTPANIMLSNKNVYLIDFGLSEVNNSDEERALDLLLMKRSLSRTDYKVFEHSYIKASKGSRAVMKRLEEVERRGRYQVRSLQ